MESIKGKVKIMLRKRIFILILALFINLQTFSAETAKNLPEDETTKTIEASVTFDWISKSQLQRDENINEIREVLFGNSFTEKYSRNEFKSKYAEFLKEKDYLTLYDEISKGKKEDETRNYCGFFVGKLLIAYGIQYKNNMKNIYYYDVMGNLRWVDVFSENYPEFPYWSYQYYKTGELVGAFYYVSDDDQYIFSPEKKFKGRWYKDKMYNKNAKVIMTRSNW